MPDGTPFGVTLYAEPGDDVCLLSIAEGNMSVFGRFTGIRGMRNNSATRLAEISASDAAKLKKLSATQLEMIRLLCEGNYNQEVARQMNLSSRTVETYRLRLMHQLGLKSIVGLVKFAIRTRLTTLDD